MPETNTTRSNIYVRQRGRLTDSQARALSLHSNDYLLEPGKEQFEFSKIFGNSADVTLEIGFGVGQALYDMAVENPEKNYLGIEVYLPGIGALIQRCQANEVGNVRMVRGDARAILEENCRPGAFSQINIFFPDPWPKRKHHKRRIIQEHMVALVANRLQADGKVYLATDWEAYAHWILDLFNAEQGLMNLSKDSTFTERYGARPLTRFETRGLKLGHEVWDMCFRALDSQVA